MLVSQFGLKYRIQKNLEILYTTAAHTRRHTQTCTSGKSRKITQAQTLGDTHMDFRIIPVIPGTGYPIPTTTPGHRDMTQGIIVYLWTQVGGWGCLGNKRWGGRLGEIAM